ncbi:hypothetical protein K5X82_07930 [Halosquirtibacter xylanolyticus]|uniref:hypothetical protein n=1 Tax=Halosquirtibacter xylanolyticus TaxID=3374599 RepID=UPI00374A5C2B|nr:hypothetical protein K5X82_07930 [Prolixibacteraceae bacterium]
MKKLIISLIVLGGGMMSCQQEALDATSNTVDASAFEILPTISQSEAQTKFAQILSKAVYNDEAVRSFIQKEALKQFDCDYDILYGKVKNQEVKEGITFKQALDVYAEDVNSLDQIEKSAPLINILLPNLEFVGGMSAEKWNISDNNIGVIPDIGNLSNSVFSNGDSVSYIPHKEIPIFPVLIVKNSDRVILKSPATKSSEARYDFKYGQFDPTLNTSTKSRVWVEPTYKDNKHWTAYNPYFYLEESDIDPRLIKAYNENVDGLSHREYMYYNLDKDHRFFEHKDLNTKIRERIYAIQITKAGLKAFSMHTKENNDPSINGMNDTGVGTSDRIVVRGEKFRGQDLYDRLWKGGVYEFRFEIGKLKGGKVSTVASEVYAIDIRDAFDISHVHIDRLTPGLFRSSREYYTVKMEYIKPKWVKMGLANRLDYWDPFTESKNININIYEEDSGDRIEREIKSTYTTTNKFSVTAAGKVGSPGKEESVDMVGSVNLSAAYSNENTRQTSTSTKIYSTDKSDYVGYKDLYFHDEVILMNPKEAPIETSDGKRYYPIKHLAFGTELKVAIAPMATNQKPKTKSSTSNNNRKSSTTITSNKPKINLPPGFTNPGSPFANPNNGMCSPNGRPMVLVAPGEEPPACNDNPSRYMD